MRDHMGRRSFAGTSFGGDSLKRFPSIRMKAPFFHVGRRGFLSVRSGPFLRGAPTEI
jgi:hypothetical protein